MNITDYTLNLSTTIYPAGGLDITIQDVIKDLCLQLSSDILLALSFIAGFYVFRVFMLPWARYGWKGIIPEEWLDKIVIKMDEVLDIASLICSMYILYIFWVQGDVTGRYIIVYGLFTMIIIVSGIMKLIQWRWRKRQGKSE